MKFWYNTELDELDAPCLKEKLNSLSVRFESSGAYENVHFEILLDPNESVFQEINLFLGGL